MAPIWTLLTNYSCQGHHVSAPIRSPPYLIPCGSSALGEQHPPSAGAGNLAGEGVFLVPPALILPVSGAEGTGGLVLFHSWGFHVMLGRGHQLFTLPGWGSCFPASLLSCGTSPQPLSPDSV